MLNSTIVGQYVEAHNVDIQVGDIFKHMTLPPYEATNAAHRRIAELSHRAHSIRDSEERAAADMCLGRWIKAMARAT